MLLPVPPEAEQRRIAEFIASAVLHIRNSVLSAEREIALLREYRTRLIADVVTGKFDVREAAARLPEFDLESGEDEPDGADFSDRADQEGESGADDGAHGMEKDA
jgi:type I restriction enzyme S subunit